MRGVFATAIVLLTLAVPASMQERLQPALQDGLQLPMQEGSIRFLVIGDSGTGGGSQRRVAQRIAQVHQLFPFEFALMLGDNLYGGESAGDYRRKFEEPYAPLLDAGVKFYAALGNHDDPSQRFYKNFNMNGERYYTFKAPKPGIGSRGGARFFALDSNYMVKEQLEWLEKELAGSGSEWKIAFFHHPPYASGMHGSDEILKNQLEPIFLKHGVNVVFTGHEHFYERIKPQKGIQYFVEGSSAKLRKGDINPRSGLTAFGYDEGYTFMLVEVVGDEMHFQTVNEDGRSIDSGVVRKGANNQVVGTAGTGTAKPPAKPAAAPAKPAPAKPAPAPAKPGTVKPNSQRPTPK